jgi:hypothetical protein
LWRPALPQQHRPACTCQKWESNVWQQWQELSSMALLTPCCKAFVEAFAR